eukprot:1520228-Prymnesium_polylepis.1
MWGSWLGCCERTALRGSKGNGLGAWGLAIQGLELAARLKLLTSTCSQAPVHKHLLTSTCACSPTSNAKHASQLHHKLHVASHTAPDSYPDR